MKSAMLAVLVISLAGCAHVTPPTPPPSGQPIDPSGNWAMTATDTNNKTANFAAIFSQTGSTVTATGSNYQGYNLSAPNEPSTFTCTGLQMSLSNGQVQDTSQFSGTITLSSSIGSFSFTSTLNSAGTSFSGTYSGMPSCVGVAASGTFSGEEIPSVTGTWTGSLTPCTLSGSTCTANGGTAGTLTLNLTEYDNIGQASGTFTATGITTLVSGPAGTGTTISGNATSGPFTVGPGTLSGTAFNFLCQDTSGQGGVAMVTGTLTTSGSFTGLMTLYSAPEPTSIVGYYNVSLTQ
jgi:hypothetical protein